VKDRNRIIPRISNDIFHETVYKIAGKVRHTNTATDRNNKLWDIRNWLAVDFKSMVYIR